MTAFKYSVVYQRIAAGRETCASWKQFLSDSGNTFNYEKNIDRNACLFGCIMQSNK